MKAIKVCIILLCHDLIWFDLIWFDLIWFDLIWFDLIWFDCQWVSLEFFLWFFETASFFWDWVIQNLKKIHDIDFRGVADLINNVDL